MTYPSVVQHQKLPLIPNFHDFLTKPHGETLRHYTIGWAKQIMELLANWNLERDWQAIQEKTAREWKVEVEEAAELMNKNKLLQ